MRTTLAALAGDVHGGEGGSLRKITVTGGTVVTLCPAGAPYGIRWEGSRIVFGLGTRIQAVKDSGGEPETLVSATPSRSH